MDEPIKKQRSPWFYVLLGCGGFAAVIALTLGGCVTACFFKGKSLADGQADPVKRQENAVKILRGVPDGYYAAVSLDVGFVETVILVDSPPLADGGMTVKERAFRYQRVFGNDSNKLVKAFIANGDGDPRVLANQGFSVDPDDIIKRGKLSIEGRNISYLAARATVMRDPNDKGTDTTRGLNVAVVFECPGDALHFGIWSSSDVQADKPAAELDLTGTVADEAELARFLKPMNPCR